jgi:hypothetical protein
MSSRPNKLRSNTRSSPPKKNAVTKNTSDAVSEGKQLDENCNDNYDYGESNVGATLCIEEEHEDKETCEPSTAMDDVTPP